MQVPETNQFKTSNTALAAYLVSEGYEVSETEHNGKRSFFVFLTDNTKIEDCIRSFETARAMGNIVLFFNAYQNLLRRIKERY